jgi:hypothetical protein
MTVHFKMEYRYCTKSESFGETEHFMDKMGWTALGGVNFSNHELEREGVYFFQQRYCTNNAILRSKR